MSKLSLALAFLSGLLVMTGLYQLEIVFICVGEQRWFDFPFYIIQHPDVPIGSEEYWRYMSLVRDVWYSLTIGGWFLAVILNLMERKIRKLSLLLNSISRRDRSEGVSH